MTNMIFGGVLRKFVFVAAVALCFAASVQPAQAVPITGHLNIDGGGFGLGVTITPNTIDWDPRGPGGNFGVVNGDGSFAGPYLNPSGNVKDLVNAPGQQPVGTPFFLPDFMTFNDPAHSYIHFDLRFIPFGTEPSADCFNPVAAAGQHCTPPGSPFDLTNTSATSSTASLNLSGTVRSNVPSPKRTARMRRPFFFARAAMLQTAIPFRTSRRPAAERPRAHPTRHDLPTKSGTSSVLPPAVH